MAHATPVFRRAGNDARSSRKEPTKKDPVDELWDTEWTGLLPPWGVSTSRAQESQNRHAQSEQGKAHRWQHSQSAQPGDARWEKGTASQWQRESHPSFPASEGEWQGGQVVYFSGGGAAAGCLGNWDCDKPNGGAPGQEQAQWMSEEAAWSLPTAGACANYEVQMQVHTDIQYSSFDPATSAEFMMANGHVNMELPTAVFSACDGDVYEPHWNSDYSAGTEYGRSPTFNGWTQSGNTHWREEGHYGTSGRGWYGGGGENEIHDCDWPEVEPLKPSAGSWGEQQRLRRESGCSKPKEDEVPPAEVARQARGILNKLTADHFEVLTAQMLALPLHTAAQLAAVVAEIFEKATLQRTFLPLYSDLCVRLDVHLEKKEGTRAGGMLFRRALVTECQASFERNNQQPVDDQTEEGLSYEASYEREVKYKTRTLGNMRFIGELMVHRLLAGKVLIFILSELLDVGSGPALESLVALLAVVAPTFELKTESYAVPLREVFKSLKERTEDKSISTCVRVKIRDLLDARARGWAPKECAEDQALKLKCCMN